MSDSPQRRNQISTLYFLTKKGGFYNTSGVVLFEDVLYDFQIKSSYIIFE